MDLDLASNGKFARCIICRDYSILTQCYNIFNTTLESGNILLSDFIRNILDCSVLIVVSPEFFICRRCFNLCTELDCSLTRCNKLQSTIRTLFKNSKQRELIENAAKEGIIIDSVKLEDIENNELEFGELSECPENNEELMEDPEANHDNDEEIIEMDPYFFLNTEVVESEVTIDTANIVSEENSKSVTTVTPEVCEFESQIMPGENNKDSASQDAVKYMCELCHLVFDSQEHLDLHKNSDDCKTGIKTGIKSIYEFQNFHVKMKKKKKVYFCNRCTYETHYPASIEKHLKTHKTDPEYMCETCGRRFKYLKTFNRHIKVHDESRPFGCKLCTFRATTELQLKVHGRQHDDQKKYTCSKCGYKTLKKMSFIVHSRKHTGERPYCCPNCPYKAKDPSTLLRHRRIHGGVKRYQCTLCEYKAVQKAALKVHMMTHTGEKPYACEQCDYRSSAKHNLHAHIAAIHSDEKPFACTQCSYRTKIKRLLTYHMRRHSDERPFACPHCDYRVKYRSALRYHLKTKHQPNSDGNTFYVLNVCESKRLRIQGEDLVFSDEGGSDSENETQLYVTVQ